MLPPNLISALQVLSNAGRQLPTATPDTTRAVDSKSAVPNLELGQQVQGTVQAKVSEGVFKVQVASQTIQMRLPDNIKSGDTVKLEVVSLQPRITFGLLASTSPLSTPEQIGSAARLLSNLAERPVERPVIQQLGNKPVWPSEQQVPDSKILAGALRETLGKSGLFYESHQAQWIRGERSTSQLLEEPQNLLMGKNPMVTPHGLSYGAARPAVTPAHQTIPPLVEPAAEQATPGKGAAAQETLAVQARPTGDAMQPIAKELVHLVQQQLHTLEQHHLIWTGQVWPGQQMQWEIRGQPEQRRQKQQEERQWSTEMEMALPNLGNINAHLVFGESGLRLKLRAADQTTVELFNSALSGLKNSMADVGIQVAAAIVERS